MSRKTQYEAEVAALSNADLFEETLSTHAASEDSEWGGLYDDRMRARVAVAELTRRLTACGFLVEAKASQSPVVTAPPEPGKPPRLPRETDMMYWSRTTPRSQGGDGI